MPNAAWASPSAKWSDPLVAWDGTQLVTVVNVGGADLGDPVRTRHGASVSVGRSKAAVLARRGSGAVLGR